jgi:hypothetical protein
MDNIAMIELAYHFKHFKNFVKSPNNAEEIMKSEEKKEEFNEAMFKLYDHINAEMCKWFDSMDKVADFHEQKQKEKNT